MKKKWIEWVGGLAWYGLERSTFHSQSDSRFGFSYIKQETNHREAGSSNLPPLMNLLAIQTYIFIKYSNKYFFYILVKYSSLFSI